MSTSFDPSTSNAGESAHGSSSSPSPLWIYLAKGFASGKFSAPDVQQIAHAAIQSPNASDIAELAKLGAHGAHSGNIYRDMLRTVLSNLDCAPSPTLVETELEFMVDGAAAPAKAEVPIILPHDWACCVEQSGVHNIFGDAQHFWKQQSMRNPQFSCSKLFQDHPDLFSQLHVL